MEGIEDLEGEAKRKRIMISCINDGLKAFVRAAESGHAGIIKILIEHFSIFNTPDLKNKTQSYINNAFIQAAKNGHIEVINYLLRLKLYPGDNTRAEIFDIEVALDSVDILSTLDAGALVNSLGIGQRVPIVIDLLQRVTLVGSEKVAEFLKDKSKAKDEEELEDQLQSNNQGPKCSIM